MSGKHLLRHLPGQLHGEVRTYDVTISGTYPTLLPPDPIPDRKDFLLHNSTGETIYIGGAGVDRFNGIPVPADTVIGAQLGRAAMYAVSTSATVSGVRVMEVA